jgi:acetoin utilization deacetylase AcuC-like enzyme
MSKIIFISHPVCITHDTGIGHPESAQRLQVIENMAHESNRVKNIDFLDALKADDEKVRLVHKDSYLSEVKYAIMKKERILDTGDTVIGEHSLDAAYYASGAACYGIDLLKGNKSKRVFCAVRPPGHHAEKERAMGFCIFNNTAIAAKYAQKKGYKKILIIDWDVHHGNGTQHIFEEDNTIFYYSIHQFPFYPGTGNESETGTGTGKGYTLNRPLHAGSNDKVYVDALKGDLRKIENTFKADLVIISAGFDAHRDDPLANMTVTENGYSEMTNLVKEYADNYAGGRILSILEGGYNLNALMRSVAAHLDTLIKH